MTGPLLFLNGSLFPDKGKFCFFINNLLILPEDFSLNTGHF